MDANRGLLFLHQLSDHRGHSFIFTMVTNCSNYSLGHWLVLNILQQPLLAACHLHGHHPGSATKLASSRSGFQVGKPKVLLQGQSWLQNPPCGTQHILVTSLPAHAIGTDRDLHLEDDELEEGMDNWSKAGQEPGKSDLE